MSSEHSNTHRLPESQTCVQTPALSAAGCVTLPRALHFSESQSPELGSGYVRWGCGKVGMSWYT